LTTFGVRAFIPSISHVSVTFEAMFGRSKPVPNVSSAGDSRSASDSGDSRDSRDSSSSRPTGPLTEEERYRFDLQGYLVRRGALSDAEVATLRKATSEIGYPPPADTIESQRFGGYLARDVAFQNLMDHPAVIDIVTELCGPYARLDHYYGITMAPNSKGLWIHGGATPFDPAQYYLVAQGQIHTGLIAVAWSLVDAPAGAGGFTCVPGSHKANFELPKDVDYGHDLVTDVALGAGDLLIFTEAITHGTAVWRGTEERRLLFYKYSPGNSSWGSEVRAGISDPLLSTLTKRQQRLCQLPSVGYHKPVNGND
jgi:Phytanoyl-CoA dioxygenase (PhyH)